MWRQTLVILALTSFLAASENRDATASFQQLCTYNNFRSEQHTVLTQDGYVLTLFRIPGYLNETVPAKKQPLLLQHGLVDNSDTWVVNSPDIAPGFQLARAGFDVWLSNSRGNRYALENIHLKTSDPAFWDFSWQQQSEFDIPANIDYILNVTGFQKLTYYGHSQGTLMMFALLSEQPDWADKLTTFIAVGAVGTVRNMTAHIFKDISETNLLQVLKDVGVNDFLPYIDTPSLFYYFCDILSPLCVGVADWLADGMDRKVDNVDRFPVFLAHEPGGTSIQNMEHWAQMTLYPDYYIQKFDYGTAKNMQVYHQPTPPKYNLANIRAPIAVYLGVYDKLADPIDGAWLVSQLRANTNIPELHVKDDLPYGHMTFMWGESEGYIEDVLQWVGKWTADNKVLTS